MLQVPTGMTRRHFLSHLAGASSLVVPALTLGHSLRTNAADLKRNRKAAILLWMNGGPSTIDLWDLKPGAPTGGPFRPITTTGEAQICEHLPLVAQQMHHLSVVRSMSTREADHGRGRYYMHTGYVPNPSIDHPSYGSVIAHELIDQRPELDIPPFVAIEGGSVGPGFLGMTWAPFTVDSGGRIRNLQQRRGVDERRLMQRMRALDVIERGFVSQQRGPAAVDHQTILLKTLNLMTSQQMQAFQVRREPAAMLEQYGDNDFGRGCLMARRLVEAGVPFVEVDFGGWDMHSDIFGSLTDRLPELDRGMAALVADLEERGMLEDTAVIWMGEFGRTPRINPNGGRDHWARAWSVVAGGAGIQGGQVIGATNSDGTRVETEPYSSQDLMASICRALGISLETTFRSKSGRPMKIANSGAVIPDLLRTA